MSARHLPHRVYFGGPSEVLDDESASPSYHPRTVSRREDAYAHRNPGYVSYAGLGPGVIFRQRVPESVHRSLTYNANEDMHEAFAFDDIGKRRRPQAMGSLVSEGEVFASDDDGRKGYQIFLRSSSKQLQKGKVDRIRLQSSLEDDLRDGAGEMPVHRRGFRCAEPGLLSDYRDANDNSRSQYLTADERYEVQGSAEVYVVDGDGEYLRPCGNDDEYGCADMTASFNVDDLGEGSVSNDGSMGNGEWTAAALTSEVGGVVDDAYYTENGDEQIEDHHDVYPAEMEGDSDYYLDRHGFMEDVFADADCVIEETAYDQFSTLDEDHETYEGNGDVDTEYPYYC